MRFTLASFLINCTGCNAFFGQLDHTVLNRAGQTDDELLVPWNWARANPASVPTSRQAVRGDR
jgi:hypothetical protein